MGGRRGQGRPWAARCYPVWARGQGRPGGARQALAEKRPAADGAGALERPSIVRTRAGRQAGRPCRDRLRGGLPLAAGTGCGSRRDAPRRDRLRGGLPLAALRIPVRPDAAPGRESHAAHGAVSRRRGAEPRTGAQRRQRPGAAATPRRDARAGARQRNNWQRAAPTPDEHPAHARAPHCSGLRQDQGRARRCARAARRGGVSAGAADGVHA